jgi:hypothetical protein
MAFGFPITRDSVRSRRFRRSARGKVFLVEKKIFWLLFIVLGLVMDVALPLWWGVALTLPLGVLCWWVAYKSGWFG